MNKTYYDILEVPVDADASTIRKAYLKKSLKYHPDKNPNNVEAAKAKFIQIGEANEILSDPAQRRAYDQELRATGGRPRPSSGFGFNFHTNKTNDNFNGGGSEEDQDQAYETYMDAFDSTVAGMSEAELGVMIGTISALAGIVGSLVGSRVLGGGTDASHGQSSRSARSTSTTTTSAKSRFLGSAGSVVGGMVASKAASSSVRALHQDSIKRLSYKEDCRRALERGEPIPDPPKTSFLGSQLGDVLKHTFGSSSRTMGTEHNSKANTNNDNNFNNIPHQTNGYASSNGQQQHESGSGQGPDLWGMAAAAFTAGAKAAAAKQR